VLLQMRGRIDEGQRRRRRQVSRSAISEVLSFGHAWMPGCRSRRRRGRPWSPPQHSSSAWTPRQASAALPLLSSRLSIYTDTARRSKLTHRPRPSPGSRLHGSPLKQFNPQIRSFSGICSHTHLYWSISSLQWQLFPLLMCDFFLGIGLGRRASRWGITSTPGRRRESTRITVR
jgi:hypothetical protein